MTTSPRDELVERFREGSPDAFEQIWNDVAPGIRRYIARMGAGYDDVQDLLQDVRVSMYVGRERFTARGDVGAWAYGICRRCCWQWLRANERARRKLAAYAVLADTIPLQESEAGADGPNDNDATFGRVWEALGRLTPRQRTVVLMRTVDRESVARVAEKLCCSPGTVKATLHVALGHVRAHLRGATDVGREHE